MKPYHSANLKLQPYGAFRVILLAWAAKALGVQFKIAGIPFGAKYDEKSWDRFWLSQTERSIS